MTWGRTATAGIAFAVLALGACSDGDDAEQAEVAGAALERDEDGQPTALEDPDDPRTDPRSDAGPAQDADGDPTADDAGAGTEEAPDDAGGASGADADDGQSGEDDGQSEEDELARTDEDPDLPDELASPPASGPAGDGEAARDGSSQAPTATAASAPTRPEPMRLAAGAGLPGNIVGFGLDGAEVLMSGPLEDPPTAGARSDALRDGDAVRCGTWLQAPEERGLLARGQLTVSVVVDDHDGASRRVPLTQMELDVELVGAERYELPTSQPYGIDADRMAALSCELEFVPR